MPDRVIRPSGERPDAGAPWHDGDGADAPRRVRARRPAAERAEGPAGAAGAAGAGTASSAAASGASSADAPGARRFFTGDRVLWIIVAVLAVVSVLVVYSSTAKMAYDAHTARTTAH